MCRVGHGSGVLDPWAVGCGVCGEPEPENPGSAKGVCGTWDVQWAMAVASVVCVVGAVLRNAGCVECRMRHEFVHSVGGSVKLVVVWWGQDASVRHEGQRLWHPVLMLWSAGFGDHPVLCENAVQGVAVCCQDRGSVPKTQVCGAARGVCDPW